MSHCQTFSDAIFTAEAPAPAGLKAWNGSNVARRFNVYRNNVLVSLLDALQDTFTVTAQLTGVEFFRAMARQYVIKNPPETPVLVWYGQTFADFIAGFEPAASLPYLADVARLEFAWVQCFHSADHAPVSPQALSRYLASYSNEGGETDGHVNGKSHGGPGIVLAPSMRVVLSSYPILSIWFAHQPQSEFGLSDIDLSQAQNVLLTRPGHNVHLDLVSPQAAQCLLQADQGVLGSALFEACDFDLTELLALLIQREAVVGLKNNI